MKVMKRVPIRQRGRSDEAREQTKARIRAAYTDGPQHEVQIIPAKQDTGPSGERRKLRVCAYCRVSTDEDNQAGSYELQVQNYAEMITANEEWEFAGIYADEGISGTSTLHREHFIEMIERCKAGEIDLIITKQVSRFARNVLDSLNSRSKNPKGEALSWTAQEQAQTQACCQRPFCRVHHLRSSLE